MKRVIQIIFLGMAIGLIIAGGVYLAVREKLLPGITEKNDTPQLMEVDVYRVENPLETTDASITGVVQKPQGAVITSRYGGRIVEVFVKPGDVLKEGDPVIRLDDTPARAAYQKMQMQLGMAQAELQMALMGTPDLGNTMPSENSDAETYSVETQEVTDNGHKITTSGAFSKVKATLEDTKKTINAQRPQFNASPTNTQRIDALTQAKAKYNQLLEKMQALKKIMDDHTLVMPRNGKIKNLSAQQDDIIAPDTVIAELAASKRPIIKAEVPQHMLRDMREGESILVRLLNTYANVTARGQIIEIQPLEDIVNQATGWITVEVTGGAISSLEPGKTVGLHFEVPGKGSIWIPEDALQSKDGQPMVYVVQPSGTHQIILERPVIAGKVKDGKLEITEGLSPGEMIVISNTNLLQHKQKVIIRESGAQQPQPSAF